ncbi:MAG: arginine--tRNA ligase [Armatimonadetes bacterium]|nr:arginine--tRNA ligase [Armatimonadota bacterium]NIM23539.1 arginine--tRNA ligase [Armatimonadota bacterium]NIM67405.1 arginine--tRNA ligase [Armatimonadota bacterium]NIM75906.1 arginine--tRNA ligase [Armatimonadota bacterium]NIN05591.1 arginine--tRNA ligase [Armatimonadota bacterium]
MPKQILINALEKALLQARQKGLLKNEQTAEIQVQRPSDASFGDYSANLAMTLAKESGLPSRKVAEILVAELNLPPEVIEKTEIAGPGFINFRVNPQWLQKTVEEIRRKGADYGNSETGQGQSLQVEFVSANPTGPLHVGHGRAAAIGDSLAHLLAKVGYEVTREYYINDAATSTQIRNFGASLEARYLQALGKEAKMPEDGYHGEYVSDIAKEVVEKEGDRFLEMPAEERLEQFTLLAKQKILEGQRADLAAFGVRHDNWFRESSLFESGAVEAALNLLREGGHTYEAEGALWLRSTDYGDEKDRVLVRTTGIPTYLAADAAYHHDKFIRGFDKVIDIWGPDHHGYVARTKAAVQALGYDAEKLEIIIHQIVRLFSGGEVVRMSKRAGDIVLLSDVLSEVGADAARFFFLMRSADSHLDFDLELAKKETPDNPVYYVQYAHARICSILRQAEESGVKIPQPGEADPSVLVDERELALLRKLADFPEEVESAAALYEPHRMTRYAQELANAFHLFYTDCRVLSDDTNLTKARLSLVCASQVVLQNCLALLGITAPEKM